MASLESRTPLERLEAMRDQARLGGGEERVERQHAKGKLTALERIHTLLDRDTFQELDAFVVHRATEFGLAERRTLGDSVITGWGEINGRQVYVFAQDFTVIGGSVGEVHGQKVCKVLDLALENGAPVIGINDSGGARIQEGVDSLNAYGEIFYRNTLASGVVPQISIIAGPCAGGAVYSPALTDFVFMLEGAGRMFITGPDVIRSVTQEEVSAEALGGADIHARQSGVAHFAAPGEEETFDLVRKLLSYLPSNNAEDPPYVSPIDPPDRMDEALDTMVPEDPSESYDMERIVERIVDEGIFLQVHERFATNLMVGFARMGGHVVGIVAQQPPVLAGVLDVDAAVVELERAVGVGCKGAWVAPFNHARKPHGHPDHDPLFAKCVELDVPFAIHPTYEPTWAIPARFRSMGREREFFYNVMGRQGSQQALLSMFSMAASKVTPSFETAFWNW